MRKPGDGLLSASADWSRQVFSQEHPGWLQREYFICTSNPDSLIRIKNDGKLIVFS